MGRQGSGKGTQCALLAGRTGVPHLSTGALFRREVAAGTALGDRVEGHLGRGELVPDPVVVEVVVGALRLATGGYLLDGFPRTLEQGVALFDAHGEDALDVAVELQVPHEVVVPRMLARGRDDDTPEAIETRLAAYDELTAPLLVWFDSRDLLVSVDGAGTPAEVHHRVVGALRSRLPVAALAPVSPPSA